MEMLYVLAAQQGRELMRQQFDTPEWQHRAAAIAAREPWHQRFARHVQQLKLLASQPWPTWEQSESRL